MAATLQTLSLEGRSTKWRFFDEIGSRQVTLLKVSVDTGCRIGVVSKYQRFSQLPIQVFSHEHTHWLLSSHNPPAFQTDDVQLSAYRELRIWNVPARCLVEVADRELLLRIELNPRVCRELVRKSNVSDTHPSKPLMKRSGKCFKAVCYARNGLPIRHFRTNITGSLLTLRETLHSGSMWIPTLAKTSG